MPNPRVLNVILIICVAFLIDSSLQAQYTINYKCAKGGNTFDSGTGLGASDTFYTAQDLIPTGATCVGKFLNLPSIGFKTFYAPSMNAPLNQLNIFTDENNTMRGVMMDWQDNIGSPFSSGITGFPGITPGIAYRYQYNFTLGETLTNVTLGSYNGILRYFKFVTSLNGGFTISPSQTLPLQLVNFDVTARYFSGVYYSYDFGSSSIISMGLFVSRLQIRSLSLVNPYFYFPRDPNIILLNGTSGNGYDGFVCNNGSEPVSFTFEKKTSVTYSTCFGSGYGQSSDQSVSVTAGIPNIFQVTGKYSWGVSTYSTSKTCQDIGTDATTTTSFTVGANQTYYWSSFLAIGTLNRVPYTGTLVTGYPGAFNVTYPVRTYYSGTNPAIPVYADWSTSFNTSICNVY